MDNENNEETTLLAGICLTLNKQGDIVLDTDIDDYTEESMSGLAKLCKDITSDRFAYELIASIRDNLMANKKDYLLVNFLISINEQTKVVDNLIDKNTAKNEEKPCVQPSDML